MESKRTTPFLPAPDGDHDGDDIDSQQGKLLVEGSICCKRNKFPQIRVDRECSTPAGLSQLSKPIFDNFLKDIRLSMRDRPSLYSPIMFFVFVIAVFVPVVVGTFAFSVVIHLGAIGLLIWWRVNLNNNELQCGIEARIQEWQPLFSNEGFAVRFIVDKKLCQATESYLHIYRAQNTTDQASNIDFVPNYKEEANYSLLWARSFCRRNNTFRAVPRLQLSSSFDLFYAQPPALHNLDGAVFRGLMKDVEMAMEIHDLRFRAFTFVAVVPAAFVIHFWAFAYKPVAVVAMFIAAALIELVLIHHLPFLTAPISATLEEWQPRLAPHGFTVEFRVDQPTWYSFREGYLHIGRLESPTGDSNSNNQIV